MEESPLQIRHLQYYNVGWYRVGIDNFQHTSISSQLGASNTIYQLRRGLSNIPARTNPPSIHTRKNIKVFCRVWSRGPQPTYVVYEYYHDDVINQSQEAIVICYDIIKTWLTPPMDMVHPKGKTRLN